MLFSPLPTPIFDLLPSTRRNGYAGIWQRNFVASLGKLNFRIAFRKTCDKFAYTNLCLFCSLIQQASFNHFFGELINRFSLRDLPY